MKLRLTLWTCIVLLLLCFSAGAWGEDAALEVPEFTWDGHTWTIATACLNPAQIVDNPNPDTDHYLMLRFKCLTGATQAVNIIANIGAFALGDAEGNTYSACGFMPYCISYNDRAQVFVTATEQPIFDLFFVIPAGTAIEPLELSIDGVVVCDLTNVPITEHE